LGGGEIKLTEIAGAYASMARILNNFNKHKGYNQKDIFTHITSASLRENTNGRGSLYYPLLRYGQPSMR
jgi:hypothetical protein